MQSVICAKFWAEYQLARIICLRWIPQNQLLLLFFFFNACIYLSLDCGLPDGEETSVGWIYSSLVWNDFSSNYPKYVISLWSLRNISCNLSLHLVGQWTRFCSIWSYFIWALLLVLAIFGPIFSLPLCLRQNCNMWTCRYALLILLEALSGTGIRCEAKVISPYLNGINDLSN